MTRDPQPAVVHVDLDGASTIYRHHGWHYPGDDDPIFQTGMTNLLAFMKDNSIRATLFAIASDLSVPAKRKLLEQAVDAGHEIASHSATHPEMGDLDLGAKQREIFESREQLEKALGVEVKGFRAPSYQVDRDAIELLDQAGYEYDSSACPDVRLASRRLAVPAVLPFPHRPLLDSRLLELPLPAYRPLPVPFSPSYSMVLGEPYFRWGLQRFERRRVPLVLLFHLIDFAAPVPRGCLVGWKSMVYTLSRLSEAAKRVHGQRIIDHVRQSFRIVDTSTLLSEYQQHQEPKIVLGISTTHETAAALIRGHQCLAAISEERLDRIKFSTKYPPKLSVKAAIETATVDPRDISDIVIAGLPPRQLFNTMLRGQVRDTLEFHGFNDYIPHFNKVMYRMFAFWRSFGYHRIVEFLAKEYGIRPRLHFVEHHRCHAASAYRTAPFDDALIVTADGVGDDCSLTVSVGRGGRIETLHQIAYPHSFGQFYTACTQVLGFRANRHEGKITGLSGYGTIDPELYRRVKSTIRRSGPEFALDKRYYSEGIIRGFSWKRIQQGQDLFEVLRYRNYKSPLKKLLAGYPREQVAAVYQALLEDELEQVVRPFAERVRVRNLCLAGGVFANVKANAALFRRLNFDNVYIYPNMGDGGLAPGAALEFLQAKPAPFDDVFWGPSFSDEEIERTLKGAAAGGLRYRREDNIEKAIAEKLAQGKVVARFNGRMEFGPRALGNRSILYSASEPEANDWLNKRLGRTEFMPFAPVALAEEADRLFVDISGTEHALKFMTIILDCTEFTKRKCPAIVHVDGTARPQLVSESINSSMYKVLKYYKELTGIPLLVNTSFNMHEEPIVCTPSDAARAYMASRLDNLAAGPFLAWIEGNTVCSELEVRAGAARSVRQ